MRLFLDLCLTLAVTNLSYAATVHAKALAKFGEESDFFFGIANAPGHVEDKLEDSWLEFARKGYVAAFDNVFEPETRLNFWTDPEKEIASAKATGVRVFRMGVDWSRLAPFRPGSGNCLSVSQCPEGVQDWEALQKYRGIIGKIKAEGMDVMLTLFHHSLPNWAVEDGGWLNPRIRNEFVAFSKDVVRELADSVDYWITFNEPSVFVLLTYLAGIWPPGTAEDHLGFLYYDDQAGSRYEGSFHKASRLMVSAHREIYDYIHKEVSQPVASGVWGGKAKAPVVGIAHNVGKHIAKDLVDTASAHFSRQLLNYKFVDDVVGKLDFIGINYYGAEYIDKAGVEIRSDREYSDSGRAVNPYGLYEALKVFHDRYNVEYLFRDPAAEKAGKQIPFIITENGIADSSDILRPSYIIEHLLAVAGAMQEGVPVLGYVFWTISDNWEWADGYCPKFGLYSVDRADQYKRLARPSLDVFKSVIKKRSISEVDRENAWQLVQRQIGKPRDFCRDVDGKSSLDMPRDRPVSPFDWRFTGVPLEEEQTLPDFLGEFQRSIDALEGLRELYSHEIVEMIKNAMVVFGTSFKGASFNVNKDHHGRVLLGVHLKDHIKISCRIEKSFYHLVFEPDFYFRRIQKEQHKTILDMLGVRVFVGPTGPGDLFSRFLPMFRLEDLSIELDWPIMKVYQPGYEMLEQSYNIIAGETPRFHCKQIARNLFKNNIFQPK